MKEIVSKIVSIVMILLVFAACDSSQANDVADTNHLVETNNLSETTDIIQTSSTEASSTSLDLVEILKKSDNNYPSENVQDSIWISLEGTTASSDSKNVIINDDSIEITAIGSYKLIGDYNGQIRVNTEEEGQVQLILAGVNLSNHSTAPIYIEKADEPIITLADGTENVIEDSSVYLEDETEASDIERTNGAVYSKEDLVINGMGQLSIQTEDTSGILSKKDLLIYDSTLYIIAARHGVKGNDLVHISGAIIDIRAQEKGIQSDILVNIVSGTIRANSVDDSIHSNDTIIIKSGNITLTTEDDGVHADQLVQVDGGTINIQDSYEAIEAKDIIVNAGDLTLNASDDGVNASDGSEETTGRGGMMEGGTYDYGLHINGGTININSYGDGLDSNGNIWMTEGRVIVSGPVNNGNGSLDYSGTFEMTGGDLIAIGSSGMLQAPSIVSTINSFVVGFDEALAEGTLIRVTDSDDEILLDMTTDKSFTSLIYASLDLELGASYNVYINESIYATIEITDVVTTYGTVGGMGGMQRDGFNQGQRPEWSDGQRPEPFDGKVPQSIPEEASLE